MSAARAVSCRWFLAALGIALFLTGTWSCSLLPSAVPARRFPPPPAESGPWRRVLWLDFGPRTQLQAGALAARAEDRIEAGGWIGLVRTVSRKPTEGPLLRDFVEGEEAQFLIGLVPGRYRLAIALGDPDARRGPVDVLVNGAPAADGVVTEAGTVASVVHELDVHDGILRIDFKARDCGSFAVPSLALYRAAADSIVADNRSALRTVYIPLNMADVSSERLPEGEEAAALAARTLRTCCDYLLAWKLPETGWSYRGNRYESGYPVRALLAGYRAFGVDAHRDAAFAFLDRLVAEQRPDGNWSSAYFGRAGCDLAASSADTASSFNLADVGTVAACLPLAAPVADSARAARYVEAARDYADRVVLPEQLPDGAFPNLRYAGKLHRGPYSVATGIQALNLAALFAETGDVRYRAAAERAGLFLAAHVNADGTLDFFRHDDPEPIALDAYEMGNAFYVVEGMLWAHDLAAPPARARIREALDLYFGAPRGLGARLADRAWWREREGSWEESKRAGMLYLWSHYAAMGGAVDEDPRASLLGCLTDPSCARQHGVLLHPAAPEGEFAPAATGWAGLSLAAAIDLGLVLPRRMLHTEALPSPRHGRPRDG